MSTIATQALLQADRLHQTPEAQITARIGDLIARAYLLDHPAYALDYNAHLVTELRKAGVWPSRYADPEDFQPA